MRLLQIFLLAVLLHAPAAAQSFIDRMGIPRDTSFTLSSAVIKAQKHYPEVQLVRADLPSGVIAGYSIEYARYGKRSMLLDLFWPAAGAKTKLPCVVFIHGGGWRSGNREMDWPMAIRIAKEGFVTATVEQRLSPEAKYPAAIHDIKAAIRWLRANARIYNIDTNRFAVSGFSSGAVVAGLVGVTGGMPQFEGSGGNGGHSTDIQAIISMDGYSDFTRSKSVDGDTVPEKPTSESLWLGGSYKEMPDRWREASPLYYVNGKTPPVLYVNSSIEWYHAGRDEMAAKLREFGILAEIFTIPDTPHTFAFFNRWFDTAASRIAVFLKKNLKRK